MFCCCNLDSVFISDDVQLLPVSIFIFIREENEELQQDIADMKLEMADMNAELRDRSAMEEEESARKKKGKGWKSPSAKKVGSCTCWTELLRLFINTRLYRCDESMESVHHGTLCAEEPR